MKKSKIVLVATAIAGLVGAGVGIKKFIPNKIDKYIGNFEAKDRALSITRENGEILAEYCDGVGVFHLKCRFDKKRDILEMSTEGDAVVIWIAKSESEDHFVSVKQFENGNESNLPVVWHKIKEDK